jgi:tetratricopeptide (TPR) repeat protein
MDLTYLVVDLSKDGISAEELAHEKLNMGFSMHLNVVDDLSEVFQSLATGCIGAMSVYTEEWSDQVQTVFKAFQSQVGAIPELQSIICDDPSPSFLVKAYEFGIECFLPLTGWQERINEHARTAIEVLLVGDSNENQSLHLASLIRSGDKEAIKQAVNITKELASYDYRAAYIRAKALEAVGDFTMALEQFQQAHSLNRRFRPTSTGLGETYLVLGKIDEAIEVFERLDRSNPSDIDRKVCLVSSYLEKKDMPKVMALLQEAEALGVDHPRVIEAKAQVLLATGKLGEAFKLMDQMQDVGPYFASKLNEMGVKLSQAGKGQSALALYNKAHKIVRPELKYKISLNSALACRRMLNFDLALKFVQRCKREFGGSFEKINKIEATIKKEMSESKQPQAGSF